MQEIKEWLSAHAQKETMIDRKEFVNTIEEMSAYSRGKSDGMAVLARLMLKKLEEIK